MFHIGHAEPTTIDHNVEAAAQWLDRTVPGWASRVNCLTLNICSGEYCVLGQVFRHIAVTAWHATFPLGTGINGYDYARQLMMVEGNGPILANPAFANNTYRGDWLKAIAARA